MTLRSVVPSVARDLHTKLVIPSNARDLLLLLSLSFKAFEVYPLIGRRAQALSLP